MIMATSLLEFIENLLNNRDARAAFDNDPHGYASHHGFHNLAGGDVHDALTLLADNDHSHSDHDSHHYPGPREFNHTEHDGGAHYLRSYIHDNRQSFDHDRDDHDREDRRDDRDWDDRRDDRRDDHDREHGHRGGDSHQSIDNDPIVASGRGAVAAGHDIHDSTLTGGDRNVVGHDNTAVTGDHNTTAFGSGHATHADLHGASFGDGAAVALGGNAHGHAEHNETTTSVHGGDGPTSVNAAGAHATAGQLADQHETDTSTHTTFDDHAHYDSHNELDSHNQAHAQDNHDVEVHHG
jgi:hypothetical protein